MNRQIRRMCEHFGYEVTKLERTRIMNISLKGLPLGEWRELTEHEMSEIFKMISHSSSTQEASKTKSKKKEEFANEKPMKAPTLKAKPFNKSKPKADRNKSQATAKPRSSGPSHHKTAIKGKGKSPRR